VTVSEPNPDVLPTGEEAGEFLAPDNGAVTTKPGASIRRVLPTGHLRRALAGLAGEVVRLDPLVGALRLTVFDRPNGLWTTVVVTAPLADHDDRGATDGGGITVAGDALRAAIGAELPDAPTGISVVLRDGGVDIDGVFVPSTDAVPPVPPADESVDVTLDIPPEGPSVVSVRHETRLVVAPEVVDRIRAEAPVDARAFAVESDWFLAVGHWDDASRPMLVAEVGSFAEGSE
jgi:hypothetical protein